MSEELMENGALKAENDLSEWREVEIGDFEIYIARGVSPKYSENKGVIVINQKCIRNGKIDLSLSKIHDFSKKFSIDKILQQEDILINSTGVGTAGRVGIFNFNSTMIVDSHVSIVRLNKKYIYPNFLFYNLRGREKELEETAEGSTGQIELKGDRIRRLKFTLPPLPEQKAIAEVLSSLDDKIDLLHRQNKTLEQMAETLFRQWFVEEDWEERPLGDFFELLGGFAFKSKDYLANGLYKVITIKNVQDGYLETKSVSYINDISEKLKSYQLLEIGDVLISLTGNVGRVCLVDETNCLLNQRVAKISPKNKKWKPFAYFYFRQSDMIERLTFLSKGSAQLNLSPVETLNQKGLFPNDQIVNQFNLVVEPIFNKILKNKIQIRTLEKLRDTLLPKFMNGEVRITSNG